MKVLFFAALRERLGTGEEVVSLPEGIVTAAQLRDWLCQRGAPWDDALGPDRALMCAVDEVLSPLSASIDGAQSVAFFPPVTGG